MAQRFPLTFMVTVPHIQTDINDLIIQLSTHPNLFAFLPNRKNNVANYRKSTLPRILIAKPRYIAEVLSYASDGTTQLLRYLSSQI